MDDSERIKPLELLHDDVLWVLNSIALGDLDEIIVVIKDDD